MEIDFDIRLSHKDIAKTKIENNLLFVEEDKCKWCA